MSAVWAEFMPYRWIEGDLRRLQQLNLQLNIAIPSVRWQDPDLLRLLRAAEAEGVSVGAWLLLEDQVGYWPNAENAALFHEYVKRFLDWLKQERLQVSQIVVDMETPLALSRLLKGQLINGLQLEWQRWRSPLNRDRFNLAHQHFSDMIADVHAYGLQAEVVSYPFVVHDAIAGNRAFQEFLQIPVLDLPWDGLALMVYRSSFQDLVPWKLSSWLVYHYLHHATQAISVPIRAALGVIGSIGKIAEGGFGNPDDIQSDIAAAKAAGIDHIQLFSLDGMHQLGAPDDWLRLLGRTSAVVPCALAGDHLLLQTLTRSHRLLSLTANLA